MTISIRELQTLAENFNSDPKCSHALPARAYTNPDLLDFEREAIFHNTWQYVCHIEKLRNPGDYIAFDIQGQSIVAVRDREGVLRAFYNVCRHRGHELVKQGQGNIKVFVCPYHAWGYSLDGTLRGARHSKTMENFQFDDYGMVSVQIEQFCSMVFVNLNPEATSLAAQTGELANEIQQHAPDLDTLTHAYRLTYHVKGNWKIVTDNFLECYHCPVSHKDLVTLIEMENYQVTTHGIYSSQIGPAGKTDNAAYNVEGASVQQHLLWWLWPNTGLLRYPGGPNWMVWNFIPVDADNTIETFDFFFPNSTPTAEQMEAIEYVDKVLQKEDIDIIESVHRGMKTPACEKGGRFVVCDGKHKGESEHGVHHFHSVYLKAIEQYIQTKS
ncbi:aromatic ring-hydroxylating dioxygenase subunit alpha [Candidatus Albibeggiatoa sp. nov. BB20]|uniref:aromatic ring-hydroxylating oxygenase subunit alpha n=1 Tax=Candidatus Albibeggiatoa sp. nov. BB20 TaxID=3162723 RepID=UPI00336538DD